MKNRVHDTPFASSTSPRRHKAKSCQLLLSAGALEVPRASSQREVLPRDNTTLVLFYNLAVFDNGFEKAGGGEPPPD